MAVDGKDNHAPNGGKTPEARGGLAPGDRDAFRKRTDDLGRKLDEVSARKASKPGDQVAGGKAYSLAFRFMIDLLAGLGLGVGIGWLLDRWLDTMPLFLIVFMLLGFAAGMRIVILAANKEQARHPVAKDAARVDDEADK